MSTMGLKPASPEQLSLLQEAKEKRYQDRRAGRVAMISPQALKVLEHLEKAGSVTNVEALVVLKVQSVSRRITELLDADFSIRKERRKDSTGSLYVRYFLER